MYELGIVEQNLLTPNSRICVALEPQEQVSPKTTTIQYDHCMQKTCNVYRASTMRSSKNGIK